MLAAAVASSLSVLRQRWISLKLAARGAWAGILADEGSIDAVGRGSTVSQGAHASSLLRLWTPPVQLLTILL